MNEMPPVLTVTPWIDPVVDEGGFPVGSQYVEAVWLGTLGPSATLALRRLGRVAAARPEGVRVNVAELAVSLGLGAGIGKNSPIVRTLRRLERFGLARRSGDVFLVRRAVGALPECQVSRLPAALAAFHRQMTGG
jgi:hypothetical protein